MDASIIIPTKNAGSKFKEVLDAIFSQETTYEYEVICVDSGSSDETLNLIKQHPISLFEIEPSDFGHGKTRNFGASKGTGDFIVFITQDALPAHNKWLQNLVDAFKLDEDIVGGFGKHFVYDDCNILDARDINAHFDLLGNENKVIYIDDWTRYYTDTKYYNHISLFSDNNACIKRHVWEKYPYPDVNFAEDQIWMRRMLELGFKKVYCPNAPVYHSHNYRIRSLFTRYYDEYQASYLVFDGFKIASRWTRVPHEICWQIRADLRLIKSLNLKGFEKIRWINYSIWRETAKHVGGYLGGQSNLYPKRVRNWLDKIFSQQYKQRNK